MPSSNRRLLRWGRFLFRWRNVMPLPALVCVLLLQHGGGSMPAGTVPGLRLGASALLISGLAIRMWIVGRVPVGSSDRSTRTMRTPSLNTSGAYSVVRNPLYLANLLLWLAIAVLAGFPAGVLAALLNFGAGYHLVVLAEEVHLQRSFGEAFARWSQRTPRWIPRWSEHRASVEAYSVRRALERELPLWLLVAGLWLLIEWGR